MFDLVNRQLLHAGIAPNFPGAGLIRIVTHRHYSRDRGPVLSSPDASASASLASGDDSSPSAGRVTRPRLPVTIPSQSLAFSLQYISRTPATAFSGPPVWQRLRASGSTVTLRRISLMRRDESQTRDAHRKFHSNARVPCPIRGAPLTLSRDDPEKDSDP